MSVLDLKTVLCRKFHDFLEILRWKISVKDDIRGVLLVLLPFIFTSKTMAMNLSRYPISSNFLLIFAFVIFLPLPSFVTASFVICSVDFVLIILQPHLHNLVFTNQKGHKYYNLPEFRYREYGHNRTSGF